jgi:6-phosphogluconolactonase
MKRTFLYVGSLTEGSGARATQSAGISVFAFDEASGALMPVQAVGGIGNPTWLAIDASRRRLYAVTERDAGTVSTYGIDEATGHLTYLDRQPTLGNTSCHLGLSPDGRYLAVANYAAADRGTTPGQSVAVFTRGAAGELTPGSGRVRHEGRGMDPERQGGPHPHCALFNPDSSRLFVTDLGLDCLFAYRIGEGGELVEAAEEIIAFDPGRGPRHAVFHPQGDTIFVDHELRPGLSVLIFDGQRFSHLETVDIQHDGAAYPSAIVMSPDGRHLYVAVRGPGEIVGFSIEPDRRLREIGRWPCGGTWPRDARLSPSGRHLLVANQDADVLAAFIRHPASGALSLGGPRITVTKPMCVAFCEL